MPKGSYEGHPMTCMVCGAVMNSRGMGRHMAQHARRGEYTAKPKQFGQTLGSRGRPVTYGPEGAAMKCPICGREVGSNGYGMHLKMHERMGQTVPEKAVPTGVISDRPVRPYTKSEWTVSLVNGQKQIAAKVSHETAKRIISMLF